MRTLTLVSILLALPLAACQTKHTAPAATTPAIPAAAHNVEERGTAPTTTESCGVVARVDLTALAAVSGGAVDGFWAAVLPGDAMTGEQQLIARSTRAATMCAGIGARGADRAFLLAGDYPGDLLASIEQTHGGLAWRADRRALVGRGITVAQPDRRHLAITPPAIADGWAATAGALDAEDGSLLTLSFKGAALQAVFQRAAGGRVAELDGVTGARATLSRSGSSLTVRLIGTDARGAARLRAALTDMIDGLREPAGKGGKMREMGARQDGSDVLLSIAVSPEDLTRTIARLSRTLGASHRSPSALFAAGRPGAR